MLIDKIIVAKTDFLPTDFTGGNIQVSTSKYTKKMTVHLVLYFGFNATRNSISRKIEIKQSDAKILTAELIIKAEEYIKLLGEKDEILDLNDIRNESLRKGNEVVRGSSKIGDTVDSDSDTSFSDSQNSSVESVCYPNKSEVLEWWNDIAEQIGCSRMRTMTDKRYKAFKTRMRNNKDFEDDIMECLQIATNSKFLMDANWFSFDWLMKNDENYIKVLEGNYSGGNK